MIVNLFGITFLIGYLLFLLFCLVTTLFGSSHLHAGVLLPFTISFGAYFIGVLLKQINFDENMLKKCLSVFVICVSLLALQIRLSYFGSISAWMNEMIYGYGGKNSAGQLIAVSMIILVFYFNYTKTIYTIIRVLLTGFLLYVLLLIQCRSAIIAFVIACLFRTIIVKKGRFKIVSLFLLIGIFALTNGYLMNIIKKSLFIDKYAGTDLNTFSSGRLNLYHNAWEVFNLHPIIGSGSYYVDNFYINLLSEVGIIGLGIIVSLFIYRLYFNFKLKSTSYCLKNNLSVLIKLLSVFYIVESFFEAYPPLGPGVCAFLFWLLGGYIDANSVKSSDN